jgi:hypothetical protein
MNLPLSRRNLRFIWQMLREELLRSYGRITEAPVLILIQKRSKNICEKVFLPHLLSLTRRGNRRRKM